MDHAVNATKPRRLLELVSGDVIAKIFSDISALLDDAAIHVDDVERAVGRVRDPDGTEAFIGRGDEFSALVRFPHTQTRAGVFNDAPADEVGGGFRDEDVPV